LRIPDGRLPAAAAIFVLDALVAFFAVERLLGQQWLFGGFERTQLEHAELFRWRRRGLFDAQSSRKIPFFI
jgi:hypothetical protein